MIQPQSEARRWLPGSMTPVSPSNSLGIKRPGYLAGTSTMIVVETGEGPEALYTAATLAKPSPTLPTHSPPAMAR